jgi:hypothetical protein
VTSQRIREEIKTLAAGVPGAVVVLLKIDEAGRPDLFVVLHARAYRGSAIWDMFKENDYDIESMMMHLELIGIE